MKKVEKSWKKFLTNRKQHDMISELLRWGDNKDQQKNIDNWTVKQPWKILKKFYFLRNWPLKTVKRDAR